MPRGSPQAPTRFCAPLLPLVLTLPLCPAAPPWGSSTHQERAAEAAQCLRTPTVVAVPLQLSSSRAAMVAQCSYASPARAVLHLHPSSTSPSPPYPAGWPAPPSHAPVTTSTPGTTPPRTPMSRRARTTRCAPPPPRRPPCRWCPLAGSFAATRPWRQVTTPRMRRACAPPPYAMCMPLLVAPHPSRLVTTPPNTYTGTGTGTRTHTHTHTHTSTHTQAHARAHTHTHTSARAAMQMFMSALVHPDWDMFHSKHPAARLHAMARWVQQTSQAVNIQPTSIEEMWAT